MKAFSFRQETKKAKGFDGLEKCFPMRNDGVWRD